MKVRPPALGTMEARPDGSARHPVGVSADALHPGDDPAMDMGTMLSGATR